MTAKARLAEIEAKVTALQTHNSLDDTWPIAKAVRFAKQAVVDIPVLVAALEAVLALEQKNENRVSQDDVDMAMAYNCALNDMRLAVLAALGVGEK